MEMKIAPQIEKLSEQLSQFSQKCTHEMSTLKSIKCSADDYQQALKFIESTTHRISELESKAIIPSIIDNILCTNESDKCTNIQAVDVALACRLLHGQNAKYLLHLETILLQFGYISPSQRDGDGQEDGLNHENSSTVIDNEEDKEFHHSLNQRRSSVLLESFHSDDEEDLTLDDGTSLFLTTEEPLQRLSEGDEDELTKSLTPGKEFKRRSIIYSHSDNNNDNNVVEDEMDVNKEKEDSTCDPKSVCYGNHDILSPEYLDSVRIEEAVDIYYTSVGTYDALKNDTYSGKEESDIMDGFATIYDDHHIHDHDTQDVSLSSNILQLDDTIGNNTAELLVSFEDEDDTHTAIIFQENESDHGTSASGSEEEEDSLDPTIVCDRETLSEMLVAGDKHFHIAPTSTMETPMNPKDETIEHGISPLEKYQVQILNGGACCKVSPVANTFQEVVRSQIRNSDDLKDIVLDPRQESIVCLSSISQTDVSPGPDNSYSMQRIMFSGESADPECTQEDRKSSQLSKSVKREVAFKGRSLHLLIHSEEDETEDSVQESLCSSVDREELDEERTSGSDDSLDSLVDTEEEEYDTGSDTLVIIRDKASSESSFEPSASDESDESDDLKSVSSPSGSCSFESHKGFQDDNQMYDISQVIVETHRKNPTSVAPNKTNISDNASVGSFQSCISENAHDEPSSETSTRNESISIDSPVAQKISSLCPETPIDSSKKPSARTPLAAAWISKYMPEEKDALLRKLRSSQKETVLDANSNMTPTSGSSNMAIDYASPQLNTPKDDAILKLTEAEYNEAPRVIKMQVTLTELNNTIYIINQWLKAQNRLTHPISLQEDTAYDILINSFDRSKTKSLLMSLVHFRRLVMQLSSRAGGGGKRFIIL